MACERTWQLPYEDSMQPMIEFKGNQFFALQVKLSVMHWISPAFSLSRPRESIRLFEHRPGKSS
jgi:hypothetical protein